MRDLQPVEFDEGWVGGDREGCDGGLLVGGVHHGALHDVVGLGRDVGEGGDDLVRHHLGGEILPHLQQQTDQGE